MSTSIAFPRRLASIVSVFALVATSLVVGVGATASADVPPPPTGPAPIEQRSASTVTSDALPTVQIDSGVVWAQAIIGTTVYAGGAFSNARPAGAAAGVNLTPRSNILAYDLTTGNLNTSFAPTVNGTVKAIAASPDGSRVYVGGTFTTANGTSKFNLAAFDSKTGALITAFKASVGGSYVQAIVATGNTVYVGGLIGAGNGVTRKNLMAFNASTGALLDWQPTTDLQTDTMVVAPGTGKIIIGGRFGVVNNVAQRGLAALDPITGAIVPWAAPDTIKNGMSTGDYKGKAGIFALSTDGVSVFGTGWVFANQATGNLEGSFSAAPDTGNINWIEDCHGDEYGVYSDKTNVYVIGHPHDCVTTNGYPQANPAPGNLRHALAFTAAAKGILGHTPTAGDIYHDWGGYPAPAAIDWYPDWVTGSASGQGQAGWTITGSGNYVVVGGEFPYVNGQLQQGLVRFARPGTAPSKQGPRLSGTKWVATGTSLRPGTARVTIPENWDRDDLNLTYKFYRTGTATPVYTTTASSTFWDTGVVGFTDTGLTNGSSYTYKVTATDPDGNVANSPDVSVTVTSQAASAYAQQVLSQSPTLYWRLGEASGTTAVDWANLNDGVVGTGVTRNATGAVLGDSDKASTFDGTANATVSAPSAAPAPDTFTTEAWIKTSTTSGGKIIGYGNLATGSSSSYDRHVYMTNDGRIVFGVYTGSTVTITSTKTYNDNQYHQVVASMGPNGMALYIDGVLIGSNGTGAGQAFSGQWRVGGDNISGWPNQPTSNYFNGVIDDVSIYPTVLTKQQIRSQFTTAGYTSTVPASPADAYGAAVYNDDPSSYWRFDDAVGSTTAADSGQNQTPGVVKGAVGFGQAGALSTGPNKAASFGTSGAVVVSAAQVYNPAVYTESAWFKTSTTTGGKIIGFGDATSGTSSSYDRHVYMQDNGQVVFGTYTGQLNTATSPLSYNDNKWHQVVADQGPGGMELWIDGKNVATNPQTAAQAYSGYWRVGGDTTWGSTSPWFSGVIDEAAVYSRVLTPAEIAEQYSLGTGVAAPTASFTSSTAGLNASFDGSGSTAAGGRTISAYDWNFGDGSAHGTGATATHTYAAAGQYSVQLTVTDSQGATGTIAAFVTVVGPHAPPSAVIAAAATGLTTAFDGTNSTSSDGATINSYAWNFGDGATAATASPTHAYATAGTYQASLVVTDSQGATSTQAVKSVTVVHAAPVAGFTAAVNKKVVSVDATGTSTSDKATVTSYDWNWGDGSTHGTGITASHTFAGAADQTVTLTVTDSLGSTDSEVKTVTTTVHAAPVAVIGSTTSGLTGSFTGVGSTTSDSAAINSYAWDFGDGSTSTSATPSHTYAAAGTFQVGLTVTDDQGGTSALAVKQVAVTHAAPVAGFTATINQLQASVNGSGTTTSDNATASYDWNWGDSSAHSTGATATHNYAAAGSYTITLTVTDSLGGTSTATKAVTATAASTGLATDGFGRSVATGWGSADLGGAWSATTGFSVSGGVGKVTLSKAGQTSTTYLPTTSSADVNALLDVAWDKLADGGGEQMNYMVRHTSGGDYRLKLRMSSAGVVTVSLAKLVGTTETLLSNKVLTGVTYAPGQVLRMRLQVVGTGTATLNTKVWRATDPEPAAWFLTSTDTTAALQTAGQIGVQAYQPSSVTTVPVIASFDNLSVVKP